jgi:hypothetical protein
MVRLWPTATDIALQSNFRFLGQERKWLEHCGRGSTDKLANERRANANRGAIVGARRWDSFLAPV